MVLVTVASLVVVAGVTMVRGGLVVIVIIW